jgi:hypothetical protein
VGSCVKSISSIINPCKNGAKVEYAPDRLAKCTRTLIHVYTCIEEGGQLQINKEMNPTALEILVHVYARSHEDRFSYKDTHQILGQLQA